jgi:hypothetical protein
MAMRDSFSVEIQLLRWLSTCATALVAATAAAYWVRERSSSVAVSPLSSDWLSNFERESVRRHDL